MQIVIFIDFDAGNEMRKRLALYNFGMFKVPSADPANQGFHDRNDLNFAAAELSDGFIARSGYEGDPGPESWGKQVFPRFFVETIDSSAPSTLSLWVDLESPMAFSYNGIHAEALKHGREWFNKPTWPPYVLWWVEWDHVPTWAEAVVRHEFLHDNEPSPYAFDFKNAFDDNDGLAVIDRDRLKRKMQVNEIRQREMK